MDNQPTVELSAEALASIGGRVDALNAALFGMLELSRSILELSAAINKNMTLRYVANLARSSDPKYIQAFEDERAQILKILR